MSAARKSRAGAAAAEKPATPAATPPLGGRIRELRRARNWNLSDLSARAKIAVSTLSKVENGLLSLTYDRLQLVAQAFDMSLSEFLAALAVDKPQSSPTARISWAKKGSGTKVKTDGYLYHYLCENLRQKSMVPILSQCRARTLEQFGPLLKHDAEEFVFVVRGRVEVHTEYYGTEILNAGEGVYLDSNMGHAYLKASDEDAWILSVNYNHKGT